MKHIIELYGSPQTTCGVRAWSGKRDEKPEYRGAHVDVLVVDMRKDQHGKWYEGDTLRIEGTISSVREALTEILAHIDFLEESEKKRLQEEAEHSVVCEKCGGCYDERWANDWHGDGEGNRCYPSDRIKREE